jgi:hypothetical protein
MNNEKNRVFGNSEHPQFPDLIKAGLKVGDKVYSYLCGEGVVVEIEHKDHFPIGVVLNQRGKPDYFTAQGFFSHTNLIPTIHLQPWNPIAGEPFPFPKFEPIVGEVYAFWDNGDEIYEGFIISRFTEMRKKYNEDKSSKIQEWVGYGYGIDTVYDVKDNCAPISEAMSFFGFDKAGG